MIQFSPFIMHDTHRASSTRWELFKARGLFPGGGNPGSRAGFPGTDIPVGEQTENAQVSTHKQTVARALRKPMQAGGCRRAVRGHI